MRYYKNAIFIQTRREKYNHRRSCIPEDTWFQLVETIVQAREMLDSQF